MFLGHYALALGAKRAAPRTSLGVLVGAAQFADLLWPLFLLFGWERVAPGGRAFLALDFTYYPWSHSLAMDLLWAVVAAVVYVAITRNRRGALVVGVLVLSHWVLDFATHRPDLPLYPGGPLVGLGLWYSTVGTVIVEGLMWIAGIALYVWGTRALDRTGRYALWSLLVLLTLLYLTNVNSALPTDMRSVAWGSMAGWLVPFWAWWADAHRAPVSDVEDGSRRGE